MKNTPTITIKGTTGSGKSALAWAIKSALAQHGVNCTICGCEDENQGEMDATWTARLATLQGKTVEIETVQTLPNRPQFTGYGLAGTNPTP